VEAEFESQKLKVLNHLEGENFALIYQRKNYSLENHESILNKLDRFYLTQFTYRKILFEGQVILE